MTPPSLPTNDQSPQLIGRIGSALHQGRRSFLDRSFTAVAYLSLLLMVASLGVILWPMARRGATAVVFKGTVEWRELELQAFGRGDKQALQAELEQVTEARKPAYDLFFRFRRGLDTEALEDEARDLYRDYRDQLRGRDVDRDTVRENRRTLKQVRNALIDAYATVDKDQARAHLRKVLSFEGDERFTDTVAERYFRMAREYGKIVDTVDLTKRETYLEDLKEVESALRHLLGPLPGEETPPLPQDQYGMTRWDRAQVHLHDLLYDEVWVPDPNSVQLMQKTVARAETFAGTELEGLFPLVRDNLPAMLHPRWTFYPQFFTDTSLDGHYFGGIGDEILGTVLLTVVCMMVATPLGIISAAYLTECASENLFMRILRTCINSLAGVPSIVFGLFGMAFFVLWFLPTFGGLESESSIWAGGLTLAVLVLPVIIRASEEAIRAVPRTYKEASLSLGAGRLRTFLTVTMPAALPGILTGIILSLSRAAGETAPILFTAAIAVGERPESLSEPTKTLSYGAYMLATADNIGPRVPHKRYGMIMTLVLLVLLLNIAAIFLRSRIARRLRGQ